MTEFKSRMPGLSRRTFLQVSAAGVVSATSLGSIGRAAAAPYDGPFTWISPRGTLEVLDDYGYWIGKKMGYFDGLDTEMQPGPSDGTATVKFVDVGQADMGFPSPGIFSFALENGMKLKSASSTWARSTPSASPSARARAPNDLKQLEGKTILLGSAAWQAITDPMLAVHGVDISKINYVEAGWPTWGTALAAGQGDAALSWEGLRAEWIGSGLEFEYWLGVQKSPLFANTYRRACGRPRGSRQEGASSTSTSAPTRWVSSSRTTIRWPRSTLVFEQFPTLATNVGPELGALSILQQQNVVRGDMSKRAGWGDHDMAAWQTFFDQILASGQITKPIKAEDVCTNACIAAANDFDHDKVKADAAAYEVPADLAAINLDDVRAHLFDQAVPA